MGNATITYITNQILSKHEKNEVIPLFKVLDKNNDGVLSKKEILNSFSDVLGEVEAEENLVCFFTLKI